ncbi:MAG: type II CRISPR-associated endonuclease Cas1 [Finegoldia magna]|uniref:type II CRISPR-associated endonuclease Cas1 n=1 Tax=Finegoldia magna TaxID=1260 RepID=UPI0029060E6C|nr:type II CRISPR-associated endonuclease Cas1 [Finegoldia magna]MDU5272403.1 type II CRISPR-associated endonuclease Cas1 [Finegoldia magna]
MGWRTVLISGRAKLDLKLNNLVIRKEEIVKIHIPEIAVLIIDSTMVSFTTALIEKLISEKVKIIFCGKDHNTIGEIVNYYNKHNSPLMIRKQISWQNNSKQKTWREITKEKINRQALLLKFIGNENANLLLEYKSQVQDGDVSNREGHAAKVYFNSLFGKDFSRSQDNPTNAMLNFGYSILLSIFTREITSSGYLTQLGIFHENQFNYYNLSSDLMEPLRPMIDNIVYFYEPEKFEKEEKIAILKIMDEEVLVGKTRYTLLNAVNEYCKSVFLALEKGEEQLIKFIDYEL